MKVWGQPSKGRSKAHPVISTEEGPAERNSEVTSELDIFLAEETAWRTRELLNSRGWCLWKCSTLGGDIIAVVLDESVEGASEGYPVFTKAELEELCQDGVSGATLRLVHEVKKIAGAVVVSVEDIGNFKD